MKNKNKLSRKMRYTHLVLMFLFSFIYSTATDFYLDPRTFHYAESFGGASVLFVIGLSFLSLRSAKAGWIAIVIACSLNFFGKYDSVYNTTKIVKDHSNSVSVQKRLEKDSRQFKILGPEGLSKITKDHPIYLLHELLFPETEGVKRLAYYVEEGQILSLEKEEFVPGYISCDLYMVNDTQDWTNSTFLEYKKNHYETYSNSLNSSATNRDSELKVLDLVNQYHSNNQEKIEMMLEIEFKLRGTNLILLKPVSDSTNIISSSMIMHSELTSGVIKELFVEAKTNMSVMTNFGVVLLSCRTDLNNFKRSKSLLEKWGNEILVNNT